MPEWTPCQKKAIEDRNTSMLVSAAAGSGKTAVMIERIYQLLLEGGSVDRMLVTTYTNAAAASMRAKLAQQLDKAISIDPANEMLHRQRALLERADITTMHAFCIKLLRRYYYRTPLPPDFQIFDETRVSMIKRAVLAEVLEEAAAASENGTDDTYAVCAAQFCSGKRSVNLENAVTELNEFLESVYDRDGFREKACGQPDGSAPSWEAPVLEKQQQILLDLSRDVNDAAAWFSGSAQEEKIKDYLTWFAGFLEDASRCTSLAAMSDALGCSVKRVPKVEDAGEKSLLDTLKNHIADVRKHTRTCCATAAGGLREDLVASVSRALIRLEKTFSDRLELEMLAQGGTDFSGVLRHTVALLKDEEVLPELRETYDFIFVDEYQDSNELQDHIISAISRPDNLFFVGDVKQSIYSFQQACPALFLEKKRTYSTGAAGECILLSNNFRSAANILCCVNDVFSRVMDESRTEVGYLPEDALRPSPVRGWQETVPLTPTEILFAAPGEEEDDTTAEAEITAARILALHGTVFFDSALQKERPLDWRDFCILTRAGKSIAPFRTVFAAHGIPLFSQPTEAAEKTLESSLVISLLHLLALQNSDLDLLAVLHSCIGGFSASELASVRRQTPEGSFSEAVSAYSGPLRARLDDFYAKLKRWLLAARTMALPQLLEFLYAESGCLYYAASLPDGEERLSNLEKLSQCAQSYSAASDGGLRGFLNYLDNLGDKPGSAEVSVGENDVVQMMTMHKSKGLEFPVVFLIGCSKDLLRQEKTRSVAFHKEVGIAFKPVLRDENGCRRECPSLSVSALNERKRMEARAEQLRLLYVAMTRAQNRLFIVGKAPDSFDYLPLMRTTASTYHSFFDIILAVLLRLPDGAPLREFYGGLPVPEEGSGRWSILLHPPRQDGAPEASAPGTMDEESYLSRIRAAFSYTYPYAAAVLQRTKQQPSHQEAEEIILEQPAFEDEIRTGAQRGTVVHFFMEHADLSGRFSAREQIDRMLQSGILTQAEADVLSAEELDAFFASPIGRRLCASPRVCRESPFMLLRRDPVSGEDSAAQGIIDCYFFEGDHLVLLDYKTDVIFDSLQARAEAHRPQLEIYKQALEELYPGKKAEMYLFFFTPRCEVKL